MKKLYLDVGNTRAKWLLVTGNALSRGVVSLEGAGAGLAQISSDIDFVGVACVKGDSCVSSLVSDIRGVWNVDPEFAVTPPRQLGLVCIYEEPTKLGVDRWLAMLAARHRERDSAVCVVDCGSAITIDMVSPNGVHMGGYILPGLRLGIDGLLKGTKRVNVDSVDLTSATLALGSSTTEAVYNGALFALVACVRSATNMLEDIAEGSSGKLFITGGDGRLLSNVISQRSVYNEDLVLEGLRLYFDNLR